MRYCCDEQCEQGRSCPQRATPDWVDGFALGVCAVALIVILLVGVFR